MPKRMPMGFPNAPVNHNFAQGQVTTTGAGSTPQLQNNQSVPNTGKMCTCKVYCFNLAFVLLKFEVMPTIYTTLISFQHL